MRNKFTICIAFQMLLATTRIGRQMSVAGPASAQAMVCPAAFDALMHALPAPITIMAEDLQSISVSLPSVPAPMDEAMTRLSHDPRVQMFLLPLARGARTRVSSGGASSSGVANPPTRHPVQRPKKQKKPSAKAKSICPSELQGYNSRDSEGNAVCFGAI